MQSYLQYSHSHQEDLLMKRRSILTTLAAPLLATLALVPSAKLCAQQAYILTDIAPRGHTLDQTIPAAINARGQVAGSTVDSSGAAHAFLWTPASANTATGTLALLAGPRGTTESAANGLNNLGQVVGYVANRNKYSTVWKYGAVWQPNGTVTTLNDTTSAFAINDAGQVVGRAGYKSGISYPYLWVNGKTFDLKAQIGVGFLAWSINKDGQVVGITGTGDTPGFLWRPNSPNGTSGTGTALSWTPWTINDAGQVVGGTDGYAVLYSPVGGVQDLGVLAGFTDGSDARGLNNVGQVVGTSDNAITGLSHMFLWDSVNGMRDFNDLSQFALYNPNGTPVIGWAQIGPLGINDRGQIVGLGNNPAGQQRIILLTPVP
jgi:probable HAF family extracellular repeat protein